MEEGAWAARCRLVHPGGTVGLSSRKRATHEYASELTRTGQRLMPITRRGNLAVEGEGGGLYPAAEGG